MTQVLANIHLWIILAALVSCALFPLLFAYIPALAGIAILVWRYQVNGERPAQDIPLAAWLAATGFLCVLSALWSVSPHESLERGFKILAIFLSLYPLALAIRSWPEEGFARLYALLPWLAIFQGIVLAIELYFDFPLYRALGAGQEPENLSTHLMNKHSAAFALLAALGLWHAWGERRLAVIATLLAVATIVLAATASQATQLAFAIIFLSFAAIRIFPRGAVIGTGVLIFIAMLSLPSVSGPLYEQFAPRLAEKGSITQQASASMRLENYAFLSQKIFERPFFGHGVDATRHMTFETEKRFYKDDKIMHPHNFILQIWIEFGLAGIVFFAGFIAFLLRRIYVASGPHRNILFVVFCVSMVYLLFSWSMWASWLIGMIFFIVCIAAAKGGRDVEAY